MPGSPLPFPPKRKSTVTSGIRTKMGLFYSRNTEFAQNAEHCCGGEND